MAAEAKLGVHMTYFRECDTSAEWLQYAAALQQLEGELNKGLAALTQNNIAEFEASVAAQEQLCLTLNRIKAFLSSHMADRPSNGMAMSQTAGSIPNTLAKLARVQSALARKNRVYGALVNRLTLAVHVLLAIYANTGHGYLKNGKAETRTRTWSCEA